MGRAAKLKKIRRLASSMPDIQHVVMVGDKVKGENVTQAPKGMAIDPDAIYRRLTPEAQSINHNRKMKKLYKTYGDNGIRMYVNAVTQFVDMKKREIAKK